MRATPAPWATPFVRGSIALHAAAVPAVAVWPQQWPWVAGCLVTDHCVVLAAGLFPRSAMLGPNLVRSASAQEAGAVVLTFDDGPDPAVTPRVLDLLDARRATATFFCIGERVARCPELAQEIVRRGHRIENHTYTHRMTFFFHAPSTLEREVASCQDAVVRACGRAPAYFRAPAGIRSPLLQSVLGRRGLTLASWTRRGFDTFAREADSVVARLTRGLRAGDVLLLHDGADAAHERRGKIALEALPRVLDAIEGAGLRATSWALEAEAA
jgi:peptidoglycan/xylan/chitin deacetylase (PgdA/CDA1 family)